MSINWCSNVTLTVLDVVAEKAVDVTNEEQDIIWEGYGLRLYIPPNSLPEGRSQFTLKMEVGLSGEFQLPENGVLVSAVYSFSHNMGSEELRQPVTLEMEHCAAASALDKLSIVRANANSNTFNYLPGGDFSSVEGYSVIKLHSFSQFSTYLKKSFSFLRSQFSNEIDYSANIYYTKMFYLHFNFEFFVIRNLSVLAKVSFIEMCFLVYFLNLHQDDSSWDFKESKWQFWARAQL